MFESMTSKVVSRRSLLAGAALLGAGALAGCGTTSTGLATTWADIVGSIQAAVASGASYIPTVESIVATAAGLFGPQYAAIVTAGSAMFNQIVATLTNIVTNLTPPAAARLSARLSSSSPRSPVSIGVTSTGVHVTGYHI